MADTTREQVVAGPLANVSVAYRNRNFVADRVFPIIDGVGYKAKIARYLKADWFRDDAGVRGPGAEAPRGKFKWDWIDILTLEYAFASEVTDEDRDAVKMVGGPPLQPDTDAIEYSTAKIDLKKEVRIAAAIKAGVWSGVAAGGADAAGKWAAGAGNTFLTDVAAGREYIRARTGMNPNVLLIDNGTYESLKLESTLLSRIQYTQRGILTAELIAAILELEEVVVGKAVINVAKETKVGDEFSASNIWEVNAGKGMGFLYVRAPQVGLKMLTAGAQARKKYDNGLARRTTTWREGGRHQDVYEVAEETMIAQIGADLGYMWKDTLLT